MKGVGFILTFRVDSGEYMYISHKCMSVSLVLSMSLNAYNFTKTHVAT